MVNELTFVRFLVLEFPFFFFCLAFQVSAEDFVCTIHSDGKAETEDCLSAFVVAGRRDPQTSLITLTLRIVYAPLKICR